MNTQVMNMYYRKVTLCVCVWAHAVCVCVYVYHEKVISDLFEMSVSLSLYLCKAYQMEKTQTDYRVPLRVRETLFFFEVPDPFT